MPVYRYNIVDVFSFGRIDFGRFRAELRSKKIGTLLDARQEAGEVVIDWQEKLTSKQILKMEEAIFRHTGEPLIEHIQESSSEAISSTDLTTPQVKIATTFDPVLGGVYLVRLACETASNLPTLAAARVALEVDRTIVGEDHWQQRDWHAVLLMAKIQLTANATPQARVLFNRVGDLAVVNIRRAVLTLEPLWVRT